MVQWVAPSLERERPELRRTAKNLRLTVRLLEAACAVGNVMPLDDDMWAQVTNTESYGVRTIPELLELGRQYNRDVNHILAGLRRKLCFMPAPIVLTRPHLRPYLIAGNTRLSACRAMKIQPHVLLACVA
jgi:hypothetical protein